MPSSIISKLRRLSRSKSNAESNAPTQGAEPSETLPGNSAAAEPPPSYEAAMRVSSNTAATDEVESPTVSRTMSASYRQTHQPPEYQSAADVSSRQILTQTRSRESNTSSTRNRDISLSEALRRAALAGKADAVRSLLEVGAEIYEPHPFATTGSATAIHEALKGPEPELALLLLDYPQERAYQGDAPPTDDDMDGEARVKFLLSVKDGDGRTPLHLAASAGAAEVVREMLRLGAAVDAKDDLGRTPLLMAARYGREGVMDVLLENGANPQLVHGDLWEQAPARARMGELGDYWFVTQCVNKAVRRRNGEEEGEDDLHPREKRAGAHQGTRNRIWQPSEQEEQEILNRRSPQRHAAGPFQCAAAGFGASIVPGSVRGAGGIYGSRYQRGEAPSSAGFCTTWNHSVGRHAQRLPDVTMYSPVYDAWKKTCQTLQEEHRRQKERNAETGIGYGSLY
ncbi:ankyrin repeat-containing domain protein [Coniochaeta sp. 2T2.1]|nr:ankyrin repeat-containing domain protein [Coniochaeta sp. 2T2.1]